MWVKNCFLSRSESQMFSLFSGRHVCSVNLFETFGYVIVPHRPATMFTCRLRPFPAKPICLMTAFQPPTLSFYSSNNLFSSTNPYLIQPLYAFNEVCCNHVPHKLMVCRVYIRIFPIDMFLSIFLFISLVIEFNLFFTSWRKWRSGWGPSRSTLMNT